MEMKIIIPDEKIKNFSTDAKIRLQQKTLEYSLDIITEAAKIERVVRENGASVEITDHYVVQASRKNRYTKRKKVGWIVLRIVSEILILVTGLMWSVENFVSVDGTFNIVYFVFFSLILAAALITTIISHIAGGE